MYSSNHNRNRFSGRKMFHGVVTLSALLLIAFLSSCSPEHKATTTKIVSKDLVHKSLLHGVRLGDGVPLDLELFVRWRIEDLAAFET